jgi:hypothetical protein
VNALQNENDHLRAAIKFAQDKPPGTASSDPGANSFMQGELMTAQKRCLRNVCLLATFWLDFKLLKQKLI